MEVLNHLVIQILITIATVVVMQMILRRFIGNAIRRLVRVHHYQTAQDERQREDTLIAIFSTTSAVLVWVSGIIVILSLLQVNVAALLTGAGLLGIIVGLGAQNTVKDFLSGIFVILENQYRVGDIITINNNASGMVEAITIRITKLRDLDGTLHFIPNGSITMVSNQTFGYANVNLDVEVSDSSDMAKIKKIINEIGEELAKDKAWDEKIIEPVQFLHVARFGEKTVTVKVLGKVMPASQWEVTGEFMQRLKAAFDKHKIRIYNG
jgi:small conductance mechanosensitive channel